jgi:hypothetical protein
MEEATEVWEGEGGALRRTGCRLTAVERVEPRLVPARCNPVAAEQKMIGTVNQADWAEQIKTRVSAEFDRVAKALESAAGKQADQKRMKTLSVIAILEEKRAEVMAKDHAGYFIHEWQELRDQVRQLIIRDPRYQEIKAKRVAQ